MKKVFPILVFFAIAGISNAQKDSEIVKAELDKETIKSHVYFLASDELMGRGTPSEGLEKAAAYISDQLQKSGVKPLKDYPDYFQPVKLVNIAPPQSILISFGGKKITNNSNAYLVNGAHSEISGELVFVNYELDSDFIDTDLQGKIVVTHAGDGKSQSPRDYYFLSLEKGKKAKEAGAKALIEIFPDIPFQLSSFLSREKIDLKSDMDPDGDFAHVYLDIEADIMDSLEQNVVAKINIVGGRNQTIFTKNVIGFVEGTDKKLKDEYIVCTAHYDHVGVGRPDATGDSIYNGARDNAVGVTSLLVSAKNVAGNPLKRSVLFVFFTAEEIGLLGSKWFIEKSPINLQDMVYCLNNDNGSYTDTTIVSVPGLSKINTEENIKSACAEFGLTATDDFPEATMLYSASDNIHFSKNGIPSVTYSLGFKSFNFEVRKYYHKPGDEPESIDYNYLYKFCGGYNLSLRLIGNMEEQPFWKEGDDYYDKGMSLYKN